MQIEEKKYKMLSEIKRVIKSKKLRWLFGFSATQLVPVLEVLFLSTIYLILESDKRAAFVNKLASIQWFSLDLSNVSEGALISYVFIAGLLLLILSIGLRYANEINLIKLKYFFYVYDSQRLINLYLDTNTTLARKTSKEKITDCIMQDCGMLADRIRLFLMICGAIFSILLYLAGALSLSWKMVVVACLIYAIPLWINRRLFRRMQKIGQLKVDTQERVLKYFTDILSGFERSKIDGLEPALKSKSKVILAGSQDWRIRKRKTQVLLRVTMEGLSLLGLIVVFYVGIVFVKLELATLMILFVVFTRVKTHVELFSVSYLQLKVRLPAIYRYYELLNRLETKGTVGEAVADGDYTLSKLEMKNVSFTYDHEAVLDNINFTANAGDRILIKGPSGHGKSTLLEVMCGILPPSGGSVLYNNKPLDESLFYAIRPHISYVSPTVYLFQDTLKENLLMGCPEKEDELERVLELSGLKEVVSELPNGLDSYIGIDGDALSLGQRQRLILARLYLKKPVLVLLDEATANLDKRLEKEMMNNLMTYISPEAIVIMVAHKEPECLEFNKVYRIENGRLDSVLATA